MFINVPIHTKASILCYIMGTSSEAKITGRYVNARDSVESRNTLMEIEYSQPPTSFELDNTIAYSIFIKQLLPCRSKAIDMHFY